MNQDDSKDVITVLSELYPDFTEEELEQAKEDFRQYVAAVYRVHCHLYKDSEARDELKRLTKLREDGEMKTKRSKSNR